MLNQQQFIAEDLFKQFDKHSYENKDNCLRYIKSTYDNEYLYKPT